MGIYWSYIEAFGFRIRGSGFRVPDKALFKRSLGQLYTPDMAQNSIVSPSSLSVYLRRAALCDTFYYVAAFKKHTAR